VDELIDQIRKFTGSAAQNDDITIVHRQRF